MLFNLFNLHMILHLSSHLNIMQLGNIFIWSVVYGLMQMDGATIERMRNNENSSNSSQHNEVLKIESKEAYDDHEAVLEQKVSAKNLRPINTIIYSYQNFI